MLELLDPRFEIGGAAVRFGSGISGLLLDASQTRIQIQVHIALALLRIVQPVAQNFELAAQLAELGLQSLDLVYELDDVGIARIRLGLGEREKRIRRACGEQ